ncbi:alfa-L-rhamnosidase [Sarocladium strictum]
MHSPGLTPPRFEHHHSGLGVSVARPRLSWQFKQTPSTTQSWIQTAYDVEVRFESNLDNPTVHHIESSDSVLVPWPARELVSRESAHVRVRVYGRASGQSLETPLDPSEWSDVSRVETALLHPASDFKASFIAPSDQDSTPNGSLRPMRFRKNFSLPSINPEVSLPSTLRARLYITALGVYRVWINGHLASDEFMAPGWTTYKHRLAYRVLDVSNLLVPEGANVICAEVAEGWYAGRLGFGGGERNRYGDNIALFAQLEVSGVSEEPFTLLTDDTWSAIPSAIVSSEIYDGEILDCGAEIDDWNTASADWPEDRTVRTRIIEHPGCRMVSPDAPPVRVTETRACQIVFKSQSGKTVLDFGQNLVGKVMIPNLQLGAGQTLTLHHAEVMENGELGTRPLRIAKCRDQILGPTKKALVDWSPSYSFHGFRYVQVDGWPSGEPSPKDFYALVTHTDMKRRGHFECSNPAVNQLYQNVVWSMRGNFLSIPTDCPQRDERLGWTGDLQVFCRTATFLYDTIGMLGGWLEDVSAEQLQPEAGGVVPLVVPEAMPKNWTGKVNSQAIWGDVAVLAPSDLFDFCGDKGLLERQFESMQVWLDQGVVRAEDGLWHPHKFQLGDWLDPNAPPDDPAQASTDNVLVANAYLVHVTLVFSRLCKSLGRHDLAITYAEQGQRLKKLFQDRYITPDGNLASLSQTGISLAILFDLYRDDAAGKTLAVDTLERLVRKARCRISTGFAGTPAITHALTQIGQPQLAYGMLLQSSCPGWLYPVIQHNATTIWERWNSMLPDGQINPGEMTSFNHYALGAIADWLHTSVAGISPEEPGWKIIRVRPVPGGNLTSAKASFDGPYGLVACEWSLVETRFRLKLTVPPNSSAVVTLPSELDLASSAKDETSRTVGSGFYEFECEYIADKWPPRPIGHDFGADGSVPLPLAD